MANDKSNVSVGKPKIGGAIFRAPKGTALPTDAKTALTEVFKGIGYISDKGVTNANSTQKETYRAWGGDIVLTYTSDDGYTDTFQFTALETTNTETLKMRYGDANVSGTLADGITVKANDKNNDEYVYVIDMVLRDGALKRIVIPDGTLTNTGDIVYVDNDPIGYNVTLTGQNDAAGNSHYEYIVRTAAANAGAAT